MPSTQIAMYSVSDSLYQQRAVGGQGTGPPALRTGPPALQGGVRSAPAKTPSIADALILKDGDLFLVTERDGDIPIDPIHATGLYYHDCRFLDGYELRAAGRRLETLVSTAGRGYQSLVELTNPELLRPNGEIIVPLETIGVKWTRTLDCATLTLHERLTIRNFSFQPLSVPLSFAFRARFQDLFNVRNLNPAVLGKLLPPQVEGRFLYFSYEGADGLTRQVTIRFRDNPDAWEGSTAFLTVPLAAREERDICLAISLSESDRYTPAPVSAEPVSDHAELALQHEQAAKQWRAGQASFRSSSILLDSVIDRSLRDLYLLRSTLGGYEYYAAGVPWFATLFGRDSMISALQTLAYDPSIARQTLQILAALQGKVHDPYRQEQPGKILHELRIGELARTNETPHARYYGTIDATPLFLILVAEYYAWTADKDFIDLLHPHIDAALDWVHSNQDERGYLAYSGSTTQGLVNHGWKDSDDGVPDADGSPAEPPIALVEVQGYTYLAWTRLAAMYRSLGRPYRALSLQEEAAALRRRFNRDFWIDSRGCYALALQKDGRQVRVCSSNSGQVLWTGIAEPEQARRTRKRLMRSDMFSGWGVRTLSEKEVAYSPIGYHVGSVWPHDNSIIMAGLRRYGFDSAALGLFSGMMQAAAHFSLYRLPELFAGFSEKDYEVPVDYPLASKPQAWAAGTMPYMMTSLLGLQPNAAARKLKVVSPVLPEHVDWVELQNLRVGCDQVDLRFERTHTGVAVQVKRKDRPLQVLVQL